MKNYCNGTIHPLATLSYRRCFFIFKKLQQKHICDKCALVVWLDVKIFDPDDITIGDGAIYPHQIAKYF